MTPRERAKYRRWAVLAACRDAAACVRGWVCWQDDDYTRHEEECLWGYPPGEEGAMA